MTPTPEHVTVIVPTRERCDSVVRAIRSVLANRAPAFDLIVVDQSESNETEAAVTVFAGDPRFRYIRSATRGISAGRNIGNRVATGAIIANTDDDCEVPEDWIQGIRDAWRQCPHAAIVMGNVTAAPHPKDGFIPAYLVRQATFIRKIREKHKAEGMGACFTHRASTWRDLGGFDEMLGTGSRFPSAEESDFVIRALALGRGVFETPAFGVIHHGFRRWDESDELIAGYLRGIGAMSAKHVRQHGASYLYVLARLAARWAWGRPVVDLGYLPGRLPRLRAFAGGFREGWALPINQSGCFGTSQTTVHTSA